MDFKTAEAKYAATHASELVAQVKRMETEKGSGIYKVGKRIGSYEDLVAMYKHNPDSFSYESCLKMLSLARYNGDIAMSGEFSAATFGY